jgi:hypothetical protein
MPRAHAGFGFAYDSGRHRAVLFGGLRGLLHEEATWEWDGADWTQVLSGPGPRGGYRMAWDPHHERHVLIGPAARGTEVWMHRDGAWTLLGAWQVPWWEWPGFAFDPQRGEAVRFGGYDVFNNRVVDETWTWDGASWQQRFPALAPPPRTRTAMVYDAGRGTVLLFGGLGGGYLHDTWEWNGSAWTLLQPATSPPPRMMHALALDERRGRIVLFGGHDGTLLHDTWEWDGATWQQMQPATSPPPEALHGLTYDAARQRVVLFGGMMASEDTWEWDGIDWRQRTTAVAPRGRGDFAIGYDPRTETVVVFGGTRSQPTVEAFADTWELAATDPARHATFGTGCAGTAGVARLAPRGGARPWLGEAFVLEVAPTPAVSAVVLSFGVSRSVWRGYSLPLALDTIGMPGCALFVSADLDLWTVASGRAGFAFAIPLDAALLGGTFFNQAWVADAGANALGVVMTNASESVIGTR